MSNTLDKIRQLEQYLAADNSTVDPVIDMTIDKLLARETAHILEIKDRLKGQLSQFEQQYGWTSPDFYKRYQSGDLGDEMDFVEWSATVEMLQNVEEKLRLLGQESTL